MNANKPTQSHIELRTYEMVFPEHANPVGAAFGGFVLALMDKVGSYVAARFAQKPVVTVAVSGVDFKVPIHVGDVLEVIATVVKVGKTSITTHIQVFREKFGGNPDERTLATTGTVTFVAVDDDGRPLPVSRTL